MPTIPQALPRKLFHVLSLRERVLLTVFIWIIVLAWFGSAVNSLGTARQNLRQAGVQLDLQEEWFDTRDDIETRLESALQRLDPQKTYSGARLVGLLDNFARETGANFDINAPVTKSGDIFNIHTVRVQFNKTGIAALIEFDQKIKGQSPYLGLERVQVDAQKSDPRLLNAQFIISSFELEEENI